MSSVQKLPILNTLIKDVNIVDLLLIYFQNLLGFQCQKQESNNDTRIDNYEIGTNLKNTIVSLTNLIQSKECSNKIGDLLDTLFKKNENQK